MSLALRDSPPAFSCQLATQAAPSVPSVAAAIQQAQPAIQPPYLDSYDPALFADSIPSTLDAPPVHGSSQSFPPKRALRSNKNPRPAKKARRSSRALDGPHDFGSQEYMAAQNGSHSASVTIQNNNANKPKRVRTGCLTCRQRHLKCDEGLPSCLNCRKSARECKRGIRLNFIDTQCQAPPVTCNSAGWHIHFTDESREIASEYKDGLSQYAAQDPDSDKETSALPQLDGGAEFDYPNMPAAPAMAHQSLPSLQGVLPEQAQQQSTGPGFFDQTQDQSPHGMNSVASANSNYSSHSTMPSQQVSYDPTNQQMSSPDPDPGDTRELLTSQDETLYMQIFVEEVAVWMDSMDPKKHVSHCCQTH